jgi:hypothetical protein
MELLMEPTAAPALTPPLRVLHPMMLSAISAAKGGALAFLVKDGFLKEFFTIAHNYTKEAGWKILCLLCNKDIATGDGRTQNALMHLG